MNVLFLCIFYVHLLTASVGWLYRYEAYLVGVGLAAAIPVLVPMLTQYLPRYKQIKLQHLALLIPWIAIIFSVSPFVDRGWDAWKHTKMAMRDRYMEHIQPARFLKKHYPRSKVVVNDVGAVAYFTDCRLLDMFGLGNMEPVRYKRDDGVYGKMQVEEWAALEGAKIAVLQVEWIEVWPRIPDSWIEVAEWKMPRNVVFGDHRIGWFAVDKKTAGELAARLAEFKRDMPQEIEASKIK